jgi:hypothetical protein
MPQNQANALVPVKEALPVQEGFNLSDEMNQEIRETFMNSLDRVYDSRKAEVNVMRGVGVLIWTMSGVFTIATPPLGALFSVVLMAHLVGAAADQKRLGRTGKDAYEDAVRAAAMKFEQAQRDFYNSQKLQLLEAADTHLGKSGLLSLQDAAWLANIDPAHLEKATDQLAVTVLQIRKMLAYERCTEFNADGSRKVEKPLGFASMQFNSALPVHRNCLRERMLPLDAALAEDENPAVQPAEFYEREIKAPGYLKSFFTFITPFSNAGRKRSFEKMEMPQVKDIAAQCVQPVADFAERLANYESRNAPLDLPAVRGWKQPARKALPSKGVA